MPKVFTATWRNGTPVSDSSAVGNTACSVDTDPSRLDICELIDDLRREGPDRLQRVLGVALELELVLHGDLLFAAYRGA